jgi:hydroxypyruvate reductase
VAATPKLKKIFAEVVRGFDLDARVQRALGDRPRPRVLAVGKSGARMLAGAWSPEVRAALLIVPEGTEIVYVPPHTEVVFSDHPDPTARSEEAARRALEFAAKGSLVALVSGGASSLLCAPAPGITRNEKAAIIRKLSDAGASVRELNLVRRHLSKVKGGGVARAASGEVLTLVASDVIGGEAFEVGSGPTLPDPTTIEQARALLQRYGLEAPLIETLKPGELRDRAVEGIVVATPDDFVKALTARLEVDGVDVHLLPPTTDDVTELAKAYEGFAATLVPGQALIRAAEPSVALPSARGRGGRSTHLAAILARRLPEDVVFMAGATDGVDGNSGTAGAIVTRTALDKFQVDGAIARFDTALLHESAGTAIPSRGPSGLNLADVHLLVRL